MERREGERDRRATGVVLFLSKIGSIRFFWVVEYSFLSFLLVFLTPDRLIARGFN